MTDSNERRRILAIARGSIESAFTGTGMEIPGTDKRLGAFVTLRKDHALRGCIGFLVGIMPLYEEIAQLAREAAFEDPRFPPLQESELDSIIIEVSLLSVPERIDSPNSFVPGRDGIIIGMDSFGASGPGDELFKFFGITADDIVDTIKEHLN